MPTPMTRDQVESAIRAEIAKKNLGQEMPETLVARIGALGVVVNIILAADASGHVALQVSERGGIDARIEDYKARGLVIDDPYPAAHPPEIPAPEFLAWGHAEAADEAYHKAIADAGTGWGPAERAAYKPVEADRIAARRAWVAAGCPVTVRRS